MSEAVEERSIGLTVGRAKEAPTPKRRKASPFTYMLLIVSVVVSIFPLYWTFVVASNTTAVVSRMPPALLPGSRFLTNVQSVLERTQFFKALANSAIVAGTVTISVIFFCTLAGFAFAKLRFRGRGVLFVIVIATLMVPVELGIIPRFMIMTRLGWVNQLQAVIVPGMVTAFGVFWMRQYISAAVPNELLDAGRVDGCSTFRLFWSVVVPAVRPAAAILGLFTFLQSWNEFVWPLIALRDPDKLTVQIALQRLRDAYYEDYSLIMTGTLMATIPVLILFIVAGKQIISGIMEGAIKG
jgi:cellobiose transport system permease protein